VIRLSHILAAAALFTATHAQAEPVRVGKQYGVAFLPLIVMQEEHLLEAEGKARGLDLEVQFLTMSNGVPINDALLSGNLEFASGGIGPMITIWGKTRANLKVRGVAALNATPILLNTSNPKVHALHDFTETDKIAVPGVKVSIQAVVLEMAAAKEFGDANFTKFDALTVSLGHPDAQTAIMSARSEIDAHFTIAPFMYEELLDPRIHTVLNSYDVLGGPHTYSAVWATTAYHDAHPQTYAAFLAALDRAQKLIASDPKKAAEIYVQSERGKVSVDRMAEMIAKPENNWSMQPKQSLKFAKFMHQTGAVSADATDWKEMFFPEIYAGGGS
jgi:NitT/TauT family transport system substrate-binding protein